MRIADTISQLVLPAGSERQRLLNALRPGQTVQATVVSARKGTNLELRIGDLNVVVRTPVKAEGGDQVILKVVTAGNLPKGAGGTLEAVKAGGIPRPEDGGRLAVELLKVTKAPELRLAQTLAAHRSALERTLQLVLPSGLGRRQLPQNLQPGQIVQATIIEPAQSPILRLRIGILELTARLPLPLPADKALNFEVVRSGSAPELRLLPPPGAEGGKLGHQLPQRTLQLLLPPIPQRPTELQNLRPGQILQATVTAPPSGPDLKIQIGGLELPLRSPNNFSAGQQLIIEVLKAGDTPTVRLLSGAAAIEPQAQAIRQALPSQTPPADLLQSLRSLLQATPEGRLPPELIQAASKVLTHALAKEDGLSSGLIRQAFTTSGLFLEAHLATGQPVVNDLKDSLLRLLFQLVPRFADASGQPPVVKETAPLIAQDPALAKLLDELLRQVDGSLARIRLHQFGSLPTDDNVRQAWQFEIPIQGQERIDSFLVRFEREQDPRREQEDAAWNLRLHFDIPPLGPVEARLRLQGEEISSMFRAEQAESAALIEQHLPTLNDALARAGLKVGRLHAAAGKVSQPLEQAPMASPPLLDEKA